ncbi:MAG: hypothetical protein FJ317_05945 [SAR202 cluster bacterium]|nr:hypothetical protein [SAR202 cluster bacterium]
MAAANAAHAQTPECGNVMLIIEGGEPSPFALPDQEGQKLVIQPETVLTITGQNVPSGTALRLGAAGLGFDLSREVGNLSSGTVQVNMAEYTQYLRGLFAIEGTLVAGGEVICKSVVKLQIAEFGGTVATTASAASAAAGVGAVGSAAYAASGINANVKLKAQIHRRRPKGWRRWIPVPAWKRMIFGTIIGTALGLCVSVVLQQGGFYELSLENVVRSMITGGVVTFGLGYSIGALWTYLRPPKAE